MSKRVSFVMKGGAVCFFAVAILLCSAGYGHAGKIKSFKADQVILDEKGEVEHMGKLYVSGEKVRMDGFSQGGPENMVIIIRSDKGVHWMINPKEKTYFERPMSQDESKEKFKEDLKKAEDLGTGKVSGYKCRKKRIETTEAMMGFKRKVRSVVWISDKFDMPLRTQTDDGTVVELRNIKKGRQPKDLFEPPKGYKKVASFMEMFGEEPEEDEEPDRDEEMPPGEFQIPEEIRKQLPKDFKLPFGDTE